MAKNNVPIQETFDIPSRGKIYSDMVVPEQITLRAMTALDEKLRLSSNNPFLTTPKLIRSCMVGDEQVDTMKLKFFDLHYLMYKLRALTYGPDYRIKLTCPRCGKEFEVTVNLDELECNYVPENLVEPIDIKLPVSGDTVGAKFFNSNDYLEIEREAQRILNKFPDYEGDAEYIPTLMARIVTVNGEQLVPAKKQKYVEEMHAKDLMVFNSEYQKVTSSIGLNLGRTDICPKCGNDIEYDIPIVREFFRPTY